MSKVSYDHYAKRYETTKPIRGRSTDVRPIGERRRDWETITKKALDDCMWSYSAHLYQTDCVEYLPNGDIILRSGGWQTPSTAEFIDTHSPFHCWKQGGKLWIRVRSFTNVTAYPLNGELRMNWKGEHNYAPAEKVVVRKRVVDRDKAKAARKPVQPFLDYAKAMLTLSDGWVMHDTCKLVLGWTGDKPEEYRYATGNMSERGLYEMIVQQEQQELEPESLYLEALCRFASSHVIEFDAKREAEVFQYEVNYAGHQPFMRNRTFHDYKINFERLKRKVYAMVAAHDDIHKIIEVEPTNKGMYGTV
jgi:hypothetical protein